MTSLRRSRAVVSAGVFLLALLVGTVATLMLRTRAQVAPHLTRAGLLRVRPGMSHAELVRTIGRPLEVTVTNAPKPDPHLERIGAPEEQAWIYARPGLFDRLEIAIIVANGAVVSANVEYDDATIYSTEAAVRAQRGQRLDTLLE